MGAGKTVAKVALEVKRHHRLLADIHQLSKRPLIIIQRMDTWDTIRITGITLNKVTMRILHQITTILLQIDTWALPLTTNSPIIAHLQAGQNMRPSMLSL